MMKLLGILIGLMAISAGTALAANNCGTCQGHCQCGTCTCTR